MSRPLRIGSWLQHQSQDYPLGISRIESPDLADRRQRIGQLKLLQHLNRCRILLLWQHLWRLYILLFSAGYDICWFGKVSKPGFKIKDGVHDVGSESSLLSDSRCRQGTVNFVSNFSHQSLVPPRKRPITFQSDFSILFITCITHKLCKKCNSFCVTGKLM